MLPRCCPLPTEPASPENLLPMFTILLCTSLAAAVTPQGAEFHPPVRVHAGDAPIRVEEPGFACPTLFDVDRDGTKDLVVGQFRDGKMNVYKGLGAGKYGKGEWLMAEGAIAEVPGVW